MSHPCPSVTLLKGHIQHLMQTVFNHPVKTSSRQQLLSICISTAANVISGVQGYFVGEVSFLLHPHNRA